MPLPADTLCRLEGMSLGHGVFRAVQAVQDQLAEEGEAVLCTFQFRINLSLTNHMTLIDEDARQPRFHVLLLPQQETPAPRFFQRGLHGIFAVSLAAQQRAGNAVEPVLHRQHALGEFRLCHCAFPPFRLLDGEERKKLRGKMNFFLADGQRPLGSPNKHAGTA